MKNICDNIEVEFKENSKMYFTDTNNLHHDCKHIRKDGTIRLEVVSYNECGHNGVSMCGECLLNELTKRLIN